MVDPRPRGRPARPVVGVDLRAQREAAGLSMRAAAARVEVPVSTWRRWELGLFPPPPALVPQILALLRTPEDGLELDVG
jgi:transcriptional regulator with XRE-family HTH domain